MAGIIFITHGAVLLGFEMNRRGSITRAGTMPAPNVIGYFSPATCPQLVPPDVNKRCADKMAYCSGGGIPA